MDHPVCSKTAAYRDSTDNLIKPDLRLLTCIKIFHVNISINQNRIKDVFVNCIQTIFCLSNTFFSMFECLYDLKCVIGFFIYNRDFFISDIIGSPIAKSTFQIIAVWVFSLIQTYPSNYIHSYLFAHLLPAY